MRFKTSFDLLKAASAPDFYGRLLEHPVLTWPAMIDAGIEPSRQEWIAVTRRLEAVGFRQTRANHWPDPKADYWWYEYPDIVQIALEAEGSELSEQ